MMAYPLARWAAFVFVKGGSPCSEERSLRLTDP